jgi:hypothetical protein
MSSPRRADRYNWLLTADPPLCTGGKPVAVLNQCSRRRKGQLCYCRFDAAEISGDLDKLGCGELARTLEDSLEPDDVSDFADGIRSCLIRARGQDEELVERVKVLVVRLDQVIEAEAGLTDRYSDDVDP